MIIHLYPSKRLYTTQCDGRVTVKDNISHEPVLVLTLAAAEDLAEELIRQTEYGRREMKVQ